MSEVGRRYPARAYLAGSCPCHDLHPAACHHQSPDPTYERQKLLSSAGRISADAEALLGPPCLGAGLPSAAAAAMSLTRSSKRTLRNSRTTAMTCFGSRVRRPLTGTPR